MTQSKLRVLCLHSFRTSASIFKEQMRRSGLDKKLESTVEFVYVDAPHAASGPPPADVAPFFDPPYYQWWNAEVNESTGVRELNGALQTVDFVQALLEEEGPFDGFWCFSQGTMVATVILLLHRAGKLKQRVQVPFFAVMIGGFIRRESLSSSPIVGDSYQQGKLEIPSIHFIGDRDPAKQFSHDLAEHYQGSIVVTHPRGHNVPSLTVEKYDELSNFLAKMYETKTRLRPSSSGSESRL